jgi:Polyketide cyclase / dehydrase and lipid transport
METSIPVSGVIKEKAVILVNCDPPTAYTYISGSTELPDWLRESGPISGVKSVDIIEGPYDRPGARRTVLFHNGDTVQEQLLTCHPFSRYEYRVAAFSDFLRKLTDAAYGQFWFEPSGGQTKITWMYSYTYKNNYSRLILWLFNGLFFKKFMQNGLHNAKVRLEKGLEAQ